MQPRKSQRPYGAGNLTGPAPGYRFTLPAVGLVISLIVGCNAPMGAHHPTFTDTRLVVPPQFQVIEGTPQRLVKSNFILTQTPAEYSLSLNVDVPFTDDGTYWTLAPDTSSVGSHTMLISVTRVANNALVESKISELVVVPPLPNDAPVRKIIFVGDSITQAGIYVEDVGKALGTRVVLLGERAYQSYRDEGISGYSWTSFATQYHDPNGSVDSPFLSGPRAIDIPSYVSTIGTPPDIVSWFLGTNDVATADPVQIESTIDAAFANAERLLAAWKAAQPRARHVLLLMPPGNALQSAFQTHYSPPFDDPWRWRQNHHRWLERTIEQFGDRQDEGIFLVPAFAAVDPVTDYDRSNALHPNALGHAAIAGTIMDWLTSYW